MTGGESGQASGAVSLGLWNSGSFEPWSDGPGVHGRPLGSVVGNRQVGRASNPSGPIEWLTTNAPRAGSPLRGADIRQLAVLVHRLTYQTAASEHGWRWLKPDRAPTAEITAAETPVSFAILDGTHDVTTSLPWYQPANFDALRIDAVVAFSQPSALFEIRAQAKGCVSFADTASSGWVRLALDPNPEVNVERDLEWKRARWNSGLVSLQFPLTMVPADRLITIEFQAQYVGAEEFSGAAQTQVVKLVRASCRSVFSDLTDT